MKKLSVLAMAGLSSIVLAAPAFAQSDSAPALHEEGSDEEIIVQARRRDESVQDVPLVVNAVSSDSIQKLNFREFKDVAALVPGLTMTQSPNGSGTQSSLRGIAYDVNASGANGTIEFYLNDAPISSDILFQSMFDIGQIEVLRGPQGTLRGRASPSGSITVTTRRPDLNDPGGYINGTATSLGGWNGNAAINVPILLGRLAVRVAGMVDDNDFNEVKSINNSLSPRSRTEGIRFSALANPIDPLTLSFSYSRATRNVRSFDQAESANIFDPTQPASPVFITAADRLSVQRVPRTFNQNFAVYNWQAQLDILGQRINYVGGHTYTTSDARNSSDPGAFFSPLFPSNVVGYGSTTLNPGSRQTVHELRLSSQERLAGIFDYVIGYLHDSRSGLTPLVSETLIFSGTPTPTNLVRFVQSNILRTNASLEKSFFGNVTAHIGEATEISGGIRHIKYHSESTSQLGGVDLVAPENRTPTATIYSASLKHRFTPDLMVYATFGTSWRIGGNTNGIILRNVSPTRNTAAVQALVFPPDEKSKSYEIGVKSDFLGKRLRLNLTGFYQTFDNFQYFPRNIFVGGPNPSTGANTVIQAAGLAVGVPARVYGAELEAQFRASEHFNIGVTAAYSLSKIKNGNAPCNDLNRDGIPDGASALPSFAVLSAATGGNNVSFCRVNQRGGLTSPISATAQAEYSLPVSNWGQGYARGLVVYQGNSQNDPTYTIDDVKAYATLNFYAGLRGDDGSWDLGAYVKNLTGVNRALSRNASFYTAPYQLGATAVNGATTYRGVTENAPREFGVTFRVAFGSR